MLLALNSNTYHGFSIDDVLEGIKENEIPYVELSAVRGYTEHIHNSMTDSEIAGLIYRLEKFHCRCIGVSAHCNLLKKEERAEFVKSIDLAHKMGAGYIVTSVGDAHNDSDVIKNETPLIEALDEILEQCAKKNVFLVIETHGNNYATGAQLISLMDKLGWEHIGINYDTGNVVFYGGILPYDDLSSSLSHVKYMHLKDKKGGLKVWNFPAIGSGELDIPRILKIISSQKALPVSVEIEYTDGGAFGLEEVHESVRASFQYIRKILN